VQAEQALSPPPSALFLGTAKDKEQGHVLLCLYRKWLGSS